MTTSGSNAASPDSFCRHGYAVIRSFLRPDELPLFAARVAEILRLPPHPGMSRPGNDLSPLRWDDAMVAYVMRSERHLRLLADLTEARDLKWLSGYVSTKQPRTPALCWHQDWWCWDHPISFRRSATQVAMLCYLTDTNARNGALRVVPGSHHASAPIHGLLPEPHSAQAAVVTSEHPAMADVPGQITLRLRAGDAVVIDYRLLHGTHANTTAARRDCILFSFITAWRELPTEIQAHLIAHPALPTACEAACRIASGYDDRLPAFAGAAVDLAVNRRPPARFAMGD